MESRFGNGNFRIDLAGAEKGEAMLSPSLSRITKRILSSITELSFHGIHFIRPLRSEKV